MRYCWSASCVAGCSPGTRVILTPGLAASYSSTRESPSDCRPKSPQKATLSSTSPSAAGAEDSDWSSEGAASDVGDVDGPEEQAPSTSADAAPRAAMLTARLRDHFIAYPLWWRGYAPTLERSANIAPFSQEWERLRSRFGDERISRPGAISRASSTGSRATSTHRAGTWSDACDQGVHAPQHARRGQLGGVDRALAHDAQDGLGARLERH